jgi:hypothetical protein
MSKRLAGVLGATLLLLSLAVVDLGQTATVTKAIQNSDGTYSIVEYPVGKETIVTLNPVGLSGAIGTATILRAADGTTIKVKLSKLPTEASAVNIYAVDPAGAVTLLGPVEIADGAGTFTSMTPLSRFMLVASPDANLSTYSDSTQVYFRSSVPTGMTVIPITNAVGEQVGAAVVPATPAVVPTTDTTIPTTAAAAVLTDYTVPMLGIPTFKRGHDTKFKIEFSGAMEGARANIFIEPHKHGNTTEVYMRFHDLKEAPKGLAFVLWAVSPDNQFVRLGEIVNHKGRNEAEIKSETTFDDFGLLLTTEDVGGAVVTMTKGTVIVPSGHRVGVIQVIK